MCGERTNWKKIDSTKKGFSVGKAAVGGFLLGPMGLVGGALGKKKSYYVCGCCGFQHEYDK
jgi:tellurium resistance protein TerD